MDYGHIDNGSIVYAKNPANIGVALVDNPTAAMYLTCDPPEKHLNLAYPTDPAGDGKHWEEDGYEETDTDITKKWKAVDDPTVYRKFSKLKIETYLLQKGKLDEFDTFLDNTCIEGTKYALRRFYDQANDLAEDHPMFENYKSAAASALGMTDAEVDEMLAQCVFEG